MAEKVIKKPNIFRRVGHTIFRFFRDTKGEMKKVVWPSFKQVRNNLIVVLVFVLIAALLIFALDFVFKGILRSGLSLFDAAGASEVPASSSLPSAVSSAAGMFYGLFR